MRNEDNIKVDISKRQVCQCWRSAEVLTMRREDNIKMDLCKRQVVSVEDLWK